METKTCLPVENGGCGLEKPIVAYSVSRRYKNGGEERRPRCKKCMAKWRNLSADERAALRVKTEKELPEIPGKTKRCYPIEKGGCGQVFPLTNFYPKSGGKVNANGMKTYDPRCRVCANRWKHLPSDVRQTMLSESKIKELATKGVVVKVVETNVHQEWNYFLSIPATECDRDYWRVGRESRN